MRIVWIYTLTDPIDLKIKYVGKTVNIEKRLLQHLRFTKATTKKEAWIQSLKNKNLKPILEILDICDESNCSNIEIYWISQLKSWGFDLKNMTEGGDGSLGKIPWNKGLAGKNDPRCKLSEELKIKLSQQRKGRKGRIKSAEEKEKISAALKGKKRKPKTEKEKKKIRESNKRSKMVYCYDLNFNLIKTYSSIRECYIEDKFDWSYVAKKCKNKDLNPYKNFIFSFENLIYKS